MAALSRKHGSQRPELSGGIETMLLDSQFSNLGLESRSGYSQPGRGARRTGNPALGLCQSRFDQFPLLFSSKSCQSSVGAIGPRRFGLQPGCVDFEGLAFAQDDRSFDHVLQFANIAGPIVCLKQLQGFLVDLFDLFSYLAGESLGEIFHEEWYVVFAFSEGGHADRENVE